MSLPPSLEGMCERVSVFDHGFVELLDVMGDDDSCILQAARTSHALKARGMHQFRGGVPTCLHCGIHRDKAEVDGCMGYCDVRDEKLIRYLFRHRHSTPFESARIKVRVKLPIFVERQWARHRTAGWSEVSARYTELPDDYYIPERWRLQSTKNKQGGSNVADPEEAVRATRIVRASCEAAYQDYQRLLKRGFSRELARMVLPVNFYTMKVWWVDLRNLLGFLALRLDGHAQWEIRQYAQVLADYVKAWMPWTWQAFVDYQLEAVTVSRAERLMLREFIGGEMSPAWVREQGKKHGLSKREIDAFSKHWAEAQEP